MKICVCGDVHWSAYSSIVRSHGAKYSTRLECLIKCLNFVESKAIEQGCSCVVYLGDFFDTPNLSAMEITALKEVVWSSIPHIMLVGNHEIGLRTSEFSSTHLFAQKEITWAVIDSPMRTETPDCDVYYLPYIFEEDRKSMGEYIKSSEGKKRIVFSHNDISGIYMGQFLSQEGFSVDDIQSNCDLFVNGHIHNGQKIADKVINLGNICGQNFSEDYQKYKHNLMIVDTDTLSYNLIENPFALNFSKIDLSEKCDIDIINNLKLGNNAVVTIKCKEKDAHYLRCRFCPQYRNVSKNIPYNCNVVEGRVIVERQQTDNNADSPVVESTSMDYISKFKEFVRMDVGDSDIILQELSEVCK